MNYLIIDKNSDGCDKIAGFDLDSTIIKTKSKNVNPKDKNDWVFMDGVKDKLIELSKDYKIVVMTNQTKKRVDNGLVDKINNIIKELSIPIQFFISISSEGFYRKPSIGLWDLLEKNNNGVEINKNLSFYVGDAAGRPERKKRKKDFADTDFKFALNVGIKFYTEDQFFYGSKEKLVIPRHPLSDWDNWDGSIQVEEKDNQEMIILVGPPASSKSSFRENNFKNYVIACQDDLLTKTKVIKTVKNALNEGKSVIVDRKNEYINYRKEFIDIAKIKGIPVRILLFDIPQDLSMHLNAYRCITTNKKIPRVVFNKYFSKLKGYEKPTLKEGVTDIIKMKFEIKRNIIKDPKLFFSYLI